jgi:MFS transporter, SP family, general alpha glucoside:H+ symporter
MKPETAEEEVIEETATTNVAETPPKGEAPLMRSKADDLGIWQSVLQYKLVGCIAMAAAFCTALDGYRESTILTGYQNTSEARD